MDTPILVIEAPKISDEAAANIQELLFVLTEAFSAYYCHQTERHYFRERYENVVLKHFGVTNSSDNEDPFF
jgi:hypothetical protein